MNLQHKIENNKGNFLIYLNYRLRYFLSYCGLKSINQSKILLFLFCVSIIYCYTGCSGLSVKEEKDARGRIIRKEIYKGGVAVPWWTEVFSYEKGEISRVKFFITINNKNIQSGRINYKYDGRKLKRIEYYSISSIDRRSLKRHGVDIYYYLDDSLVKRRIIEYEHNQKTGGSIQISQYVVRFKKNSVQSMETWMLEKKTKKIIKNKEDSTSIIHDMIGNIEKSQRDRCKGTRLIDI